MLKKINYHAYFVLFMLFSQLSITVTATYGLSGDDLIAAEAEFINDVKFVCQLYNKWIHYKCASLKDPINQMAQLYQVNFLQKEYLKVVSLSVLHQEKKIEIDFDKKLHQLKTTIGHKGYFYSWYEKDTAWLSEGITSEEKQKFLELSHQKARALPLLRHLAELEYRYCGRIGFNRAYRNRDTDPSENDILFQKDHTEFAKKVAGRNALHCKLFPHLAGCKNLDDIIRQDLAHLRSLMLTSQGDKSYAYLDKLELCLKLDESSISADCNPILEIDIFTHLI